MTPQKGISTLYQRIRTTFPLSFWARVVTLSLLLGFGLLAGGLLTSKPAHAQQLTSTTITDCTDDSQLQSAVANAASGDTITFGCSGDISLSKTLTIATNLTLDGSGQSVILDGHNSVQVLSVNGGVSFKLNALTVAHGSTAANGGGLYNGGIVNISNSTFANNSSTDNNGGGLYNGGTVNISNSTFASNSATFGGGGIENLGQVNISNSTFTSNSASYGGGGIEVPEGSVSITQSIVAHNIGGRYSAANGNCLGPVSSQGYNLESSTDCGFTGTGDLQNTNPMLASALANNGGSTQTLALLDGSPAINKIPASSCPSIDQRGISRPQGPACDIGAFEFRVPVLNLPSSPVSVDATSPQGATVTYTATASEPDDASATPSVSCSSASGSTFPIGTTTVNCTASDAANPPDITMGSFQVVVVADTDLGLTNMPANMTTNATGSQGAVVAYTQPTVVDEDSPLPPVNCTPASGSTFAIGTTTVTCTVSDSDDTNSPVSQSFTVTVNGAATQISNLETTVNSFHFKPTIQKTLDAELQAALNAINQGKTKVACIALDVFNGEVKLLTGHGITSSQATQLIASATQIKAVLGC